MFKGMTIASLAVVALAGSALGGQVWLNSSKIQGITETGSVGQAKFRLSQTNFDMTIDRGQGTNVGQFIAANLGTNGQLNNVAFNFVLQHIAGEGLVFSMTNTNTTATSKLSWGSFTTPPGGTTTVMLGGERVAGPANPNAARRSFNALRLDAQANRTNPPGSQMKFQNLVFNGLPVADGALNNGMVTTPSGGPASANIVQWVVSDTNLAAVNWTLTGTLTGYRDTAVGGDEQVKFTIGEKQIDFTIIPLPAGVALSLAGLGVVGLRRQRKL
jgi:hypothetical protein